MKSRKLAMSMSQICLKRSDLNKMKTSHPINSINSKIWKMLHWKKKTFNMIPLKIRWKKRKIRKINKLVNGMKLGAMTLIKKLTSLSQRIKLDKSLQGRKKLLMKLLKRINLNLSFLYREKRQGDKMECQWSNKI